MLSVAISKRIVGDWEPATTDVVDSLEVTGKQGHFPAALWEQGRADEPAAAMLAAIGGSQLVAGLTVTEHTGAFGDHATVPLSTLVEEQPTLPLPLGPAGGPTWPGQTEPSVPKPVPGRRRTTQPRLLGVGRRRAAGTPWSGRGAPRDDQRRDGDTTAVRLDPGAAAVWDVRDLRFADLALDREGAALRLIALTAGGRPLVDRAVPAGAGLATLLPPRTARVALLPAGEADPEQDRAAGWRLRDELIRVGPGTFLAGDAVVLTATPVPSAGRYPGAVATVPAVSVLAGQPATTTVVHGPGNVLVVKCSASTDPLIDVRGGEAGRLQRVPAADGALLVVPIRRAAGPLRVRVSGTGTAAVLIVDGAAPAWVDRLTDRPGLPRPVVPGVVPSASICVHTSREGDRHDRDPPDREHPPVRQRGARHHGRCLPGALVARRRISRGHAGRPAVARRLHRGGRPAGSPCRRPMWRPSTRRPARSAHTASGCRTSR